MKMAGPGAALPLSKADAAKVLLRGGRRRRQRHQPKKYVVEANVQKKRLRLEILEL